MIGTAGSGVDDADARPVCGEGACPTQRPAPPRKAKPKPRPARRAVKPKPAPAPTTGPRTADAAEAWAENDRPARRKPKRARRAPKPKPAPAPTTGPRTADAAEAWARNDRRTSKPKRRTRRAKHAAPARRVKRADEKPSARRKLERLERQGGPWAEMFLPQLAPRERVDPVIPPPRLRRVRIDANLPGLPPAPRVRRVPDKDPVLWDEACTMGLNPGCDVQAAARRLRNDRLHYGIGRLLLPHSQPWRVESEGFRANEQEWHEAQQRARERREGGDEVRSVWDHVKGFGTGVREWGTGLWDTAVRGYESTTLISCSPGAGGCSMNSLPGVSPEERDRAMKENEQGAEFLVEHPDEAAKALINWEDLAEGRYGEWLGQLAPDIAITIATAGGGAVTKVTRTSGALDAPSPRPTRSRTPDGGRIDGSPDAREVLEELFGHTSSLRTSPRPDHVIPTRVRGGASELRVLYDWSGRPYIRQITPIAHRPGGRSPDFVVTLRDGRRVRVEVTTVATGAGSGYRRRGFGRSGPVTKARVTGAIDRKVKGGRTQFNAPLDDVPEGGILSLHLRGPAGPAAAAADEAIAARLKALRAAKVRTVEVNLTDRRVIRYTLTAAGEVRRRVLPGR